MTAKRPLRFTQITVGQWTTKEGQLNHTLIGLSEDGQVYTFNRTADAWIPTGTRTAKPQ